MVHEAEIHHEREFEEIHHEEECGSGPHVLHLGKAHREKINHHERARGVRDQGSEACEDAHDPCKPNGIVGRRRVCPGASKQVQRRQREDDDPDREATLVLVHVAEREEADDDTRCAPRNQPPDVGPVRMAAVEQEGHDVPEDEER